jgi:integrase
LRRSELVSIKLEDIYEDRGVTVLRIKGKGDKVRVLPLSDTLVVNLKEYLKNYGTVLDQKDYLFQSHKDIRNVQAMSGTTVYKIVNKYAKILGITKRVGAHSCRATVISHLLENSVSPRDVANFAGHSSINTTVGIYDKRRDEIKNSAAYKVKF